MPAGRNIVPIATSSTSEGLATGVVAVACTAPVLMQLESGSGGRLFVVGPGSGGIVGSKVVAGLGDMTRSGDVWPTTSSGALGYTDLSFCSLSAAVIQSMGIVLLRKYPL